MSHLEHPRPGAAVTFPSFNQSWSCWGPTSSVFSTDIHALPSNPPHNPQCCCLAGLTLNTLTLSVAPPLAMTSTPPQFKPGNSSSCYSPTLSPSPLKTHSTMDTNDLFSSPSASRLVGRRGPDSAPPCFPTRSNAAPLQTLVKDSLLNLFHFPGGLPRYADAGVGAKQKPTPLFKTTP